MRSKKRKLNIGIIGCGAIGTKRAAAILDIGKDKIVGVHDISKKSAKRLADFSGAAVYSSVQKLFSDKFIDAVVVSTTTDVSAKITAQALKADKHVLVEKPLGSDAKEALSLASLAKRPRKVLKVGFNHRHHPAIFQAYNFVRKGIIGKVFYIKAVYGHGARPGYDLDWRMQKKYSRGGELFDQGVHIIDLMNWFLGDFKEVFADTKNYFWKKSNLEDNAFCRLVSNRNQIVQFHVSLTQWKNKFLLELVGSKGYLTVNGLGRSYGVETLTLGTGVGKGKVPKEKVWKFEGPDQSWKEEWREFRKAVLQNKKPLAGAEDNAKTMKVLDALYKSAKSGKIIKI